MAQSSRAGISYSDFWKMSPREWTAFMDGFALHEEDEWRRIRAIYTLMYNTHVDHYNQMKAEELIPLPGDAKERVKMLTDDEREELAKRYGFMLSEI
jgi:hypothetical protein